MGRNKKIKTRIAGLERAIRVHEKKFEVERSNPHSNTRWIQHWRGEIDEWKKQIERLTERLTMR